MPSKMVIGKLKFNLFRVAIVCFTASICSPLAAFAADWRLANISGVVRVQEPGAGSSALAKQDQIVAAGSTIITGATGAATVVYGKNKLSVSPNSRMTIAPQSTDLFTKIIQPLGSIFYQVEKRPEQHFSVDTPYLAAVVKGTSFTVESGGARDIVRVRTGIVDVEPHTGAPARDIPAGRSISVGAGRADITLLDADGKPVDGGAAAWGGDDEGASGASKDRDLAPDSRLKGARLPFIFSSANMKQSILIIVLCFLGVFAAVKAFQFARDAFGAKSGGSNLGGWRAYSEIESVGDEKTVLIILHDRNGGPIDGAKVSGDLEPVSSKGPKVSLRFGPTGKGSYRASAGSLAPGAYLLKAAAENDGQNLDVERRHSV